MSRSMRPTRARRPSDASVDPTEARNATALRETWKRVGCRQRPTSWGPVNPSYFLATCLPRNSRISLAISEVVPCVVEM